MSSSRVGWGRRALGKGLGVGSSALARAGDRVAFDHREEVGGLWEEHGQRQLDFLVEQGLARADNVLDVGCGSLRAGVPLVGWLDQGRYCGIDRSGALIAAGRRELAAAGLADRGADLLVGDRFEVGRFGRRFEVALAQSVFTHLPLDEIRTCLVRVAEVLEPGGRFFVTCFVQTGEPASREPIDWPSTDGRLIRTYPDRNPWHHPIDTWPWVARGLPLELDVIGAWGHPRGQQMLCFTRSGSA